MGRALGLQLGGVERIELPEISQFGQTRVAAAGLTAVAATVTFAIVGGASGEGAREILAHGTASEPVEPTNARRNRSIKRAVMSARRVVVPPAARAARRGARMAARSARLALGPIVSIEETSAPTYYGPSFYDPAIGSFGPGKFCGFVQHPVVGPDPETGETRVLRRVRRRRCNVPNPYVLHVEIRYEAQ